MSNTSYVIVGGGMTADAAVRGIREIDSNGSIALIGAEPDPPYKRPPLSEGLWNGKPSAISMLASTPLLTGLFRSAKGSSITCARAASAAC